MKRHTTRVAAIVGIGFALVMPINRAFAEADAEKRAFGESEFSNQLHAEWQRRALSLLSAEWCQWAFSIPAGVNPLSDTQGTNAPVGEHGRVWFLAGLVGPPGGTVTRDCSVPENVQFFFPVVNFVDVNTPYECGQKEPLTASQLRDQIAPLVDQAVEVYATLDGCPITNVQRVKSTVFVATFPADNEFTVACGSLVSAGVHSPCVADGYYVLLNPLNPGQHTLHFHAKIPDVLTEDVTYHLTVVRVDLQ
jgi:hypothetical protein